MNDTTPRDDRPVLVADGRSRVSLGKHGSVKPGQMFLLEVDDTGILTLTPATAVPVWATDEPNRD